MTTRRSGALAVIAGLAVLVVVAALRSPPSGESLRPPAPSQLTDVEAALARACPPIGSEPRIDTALAPLHVADVASFDQPTALEVSDEFGLMVGERSGRIHVVEEDDSRTLLLDLSADTSTEADQGLLELAVHDGHLLVFRTDSVGDVVLTAHHIVGSTADPAGIELLRVPQPSPRHNGGGLAVDTSGVIYVGLGDGGDLTSADPASPNDPSLLGTIVRGRLDLAAGLITPADGADTIVWAVGLRNPHRIWIDDDASWVWITDVGENCREELNRVSTSAGQLDLGWRRVEGDLPFLGTVTQEMTAPVYVHDHDGGRCAIIGGAMLPGTFADPVSGLTDAPEAVVADMCSGEMFAVSATTSRRLPISMPNIVDIAVRSDGVLLVADIAGTVRAVSR